MCIGSDSQATVNAHPRSCAGWSIRQRLRKKRRRAVLATTTRQTHVGTRLWHEAARLTGARGDRSTRGSNRQSVERADWLVLDSEHAIHGSRAAAEASALDHLVFAGADSAAIRDVMVGGRIGWSKDRRHAAEEELRPAVCGVLFSELAAGA